MSKPNPTTLHDPDAHPKGLECDRNRWADLHLTGLPPKLDIEGWRRARESNLRALDR